MKYTLERTEYLKSVTLGKLYNDEGEFVAFTLEEPWQDNKRQVSCIPEGIYICKPHSGTKFKDVWEVTNVPNRKAILIHSGNTTLDIEGCILVGKRKGVLKGLAAVLESKLALDELRKAIGIETTFTLEVKNGNKS